VDRPRSPVTDLNAAVGQVTTRGLREGEVVTESALVPPVLVKRGDPVTVYCPTGGLLIKLTGTAMEDGAAGGIIRIRNEASREVFWAEVTGPRQAVARVDGAAGQGLAAEAEAQP
jgi:flagella basal body P-ring formation protein FlgA